MPGYLPTRFRLIDERDAYARNAEAHAQKLKRFLRDNEATIAQFHTSMLHQHALSRQQVWRITRNYPHMTLEGRVTHGSPEVRVVVLHTSEESDDVLPQYLILEFVWVDARSHEFLTMHGHFIDIDGGATQFFNDPVALYHFMPYVDLPEIELDPFGPRKVPSGSYGGFREQRAANPYARIEVTRAPTNEFEIALDRERLWAGHGTQFTTRWTSNDGSRIPIIRWERLVHPTNRAVRDLFAYSFTRPEMVSPLHSYPERSTNRVAAILAGSNLRALTAVIRLNPVRDQAVAVHWFWGPQGRGRRRFSAFKTPIWLEGDGLPVPSLPPTESRSVSVPWLVGGIYGPLPEPGTSIFLAERTIVYDLQNAGRAWFEQWKAAGLLMAGTATEANESIGKLQADQKDDPTPPTEVTVYPTFVGGLPLGAEDSLPEIDRFWDDQENAQYIVRKKPPMRFMPTLTKGKPWVPPTEWQTEAPLVGTYAVQGWSIYPR